MNKTKSIATALAIVFWLALLCFSINFQVQQFRTSIPSSAVSSDQQDFITPVSAEHAVAWIEQVLDLEVISSFKNWALPASLLAFLLLYADACAIKKQLRHSFNFIFLSLRFRIFPNAP
ncbi:hypothetical protein [Pontibacter vulgaris]|uniref:hypothetical protein n=1 Tax=Pontibacter vulgaris TaxID=2905679 RepID=UPI001FA736B5|nr:hypothetical protein [Pontibacter vulgaris]